MIALPFLHFMSYFPLIKFLNDLMHTISKLLYRTSWWNFIAKYMRLRECVKYKKIALPFSISELLPFDEISDLVGTINR